MRILSKLSDFIVTVRKGARTQSQRQGAAGPKTRAPASPPDPSPPATEAAPPPRRADTCSAFDFLAELDDTPRPPPEVPQASPPALPPLAQPPAVLATLTAGPATHNPAPAGEPAFRLKRPSPPPMLHPLPAEPTDAACPPAEVREDTASAQLSLLDYTPPPKVQAPSAPASVHGPAISVEDVALAVGRAVDGINQRRTNDALELLLTAHKEEVALFTHADRERNEKFVSALLEARTDYREHIDRAVTRVIEELADGHTIPAALGQLADQAGAHYRRSERMQEKLLLGLRELTDTMKTHIERIDALLQVAQAKPASEPARLLTLVAPTATPASLAASRPAQRSPIDDIPDDDDVEQETGA